VLVDDHQVPDQRGGEATHGQGLGAVTVDDLQLGGQDKVTGDLAARPVPRPWVVRRAGGGVSGQHLPLVA
jgi:hypothetical protein